MATYKPEKLNISAPSGGFQQGGWYSGRQYWGGTLSEPGQIHPSSNQQGAGQDVSQEVVQQSSPQNWDYLQEQKQVSTQIQADQIKPPTNLDLPNQMNTGLQSELESTRNLLDKTLSERFESVDKKRQEARAREEETLEKMKPLTEPFREKLAEEKRAEYKTEEVMASQKSLLDELDTLLTEGNDLIRQQKEVTGLASIRNPRIQKTMDDVAARAGVINAVVNLQNTYLANAYQSIDRSIGHINADRQDQLNYYNTILNLANRDIIDLTDESRRIADMQTKLIENDFNNAQETVNTIKQLMIDPGSASLMAQAGVSLNDSVETINSKMAQAQYSMEVNEMANEITMEGGTPIVDPSSVPTDQLKSFTDSRGQVHYYKMPKEKTTGTGTASERSASEAASIISANSMNFPDVVVKFANQLSLSEIYSAYNQSGMGEQWGLPGESPNEIALLYKWARGEITEAEYREAMGEEE
jgi:hypothetical protein